MSRHLLVLALFIAVLAIVLADDEEDSEKGKMRMKAMGFSQMRPKEDRAGKFKGMMTAEGQNGQTGKMRARRLKNRTGRDKSELMAKLKERMGSGKMSEKAKARMERRIAMLEQKIAETTTSATTVPAV